MESLLKLPVDVLEKAVKESGLGSTNLNSVSQSTSREAEQPMKVSNATWTTGETVQAMREAFSADESTQDQDYATPESMVKASRSLTSEPETSSAGASTNVVHNVLAPPAFKPLPPKDEAVQLLELYFSMFNKVFPLYHQQTFMQVLQEHYTTGQHENAGWWAGLNVLLAFGSRLKSFKNEGYSDGEAEAWGYIENALAVAPSLAMLTPSLLNIQALLGLVMFLQSTPKSRSYSLHIATAIRLGQSLGLHRQEAYGHSFTPIEKEQRKRVFWIGYFLDKDISMRSGHPPIQHDDEIDVDSPSDSFTEDGAGYVFFSNPVWPMNLFRLRIQLAGIQSSIRNDLYTAKAAKHGVETRKILVQKLDERLRQWKNSTLIDFEPEYLAKLVKEPFDILHIVVLYFTYFNCLTLIHRSSFQNMSWKSRSPSAIEPFNPRNFSSKQIVIDTARTALNLLRLVPQNNYACIWYGPTDLFLVRFNLSCTTNFDCVGSSSNSLSQQSSHFSVMSNSTLHFQLLSQITSWSSFSSACFARLQHIT
jgi:hypothetical protein